MTRTLARCLVPLLAATALAACGGKSSSSTTPEGGDTGDDTTTDAPATDATPFDDAQVQATIAAMPVPEQCGGPEAAANLGALLDAQRAALGSDDETEVSMTCRPADGEPWQCDWSVFTKPTGAVDPEDPCAGEGGSGYQIMFQVDDAGTIVADSLGCVAPG